MLHADPNYTYVTQGVRTHPDMLLETSALLQGPTLCANRLLPTTYFTYHTNITSERGASRKDALVGDVEDFPRPAEGKA